MHHKRLLSRMMIELQVIPNYPYVKMVIMNEWVVDVKAMSLPSRMMIELQVILNFSYVVKMVIINE